MSDTDQIPVDRLRAAQAASDLDAVAIECDDLQRRIIDAADATTAKPAAEAAEILRDLARDLRTMSQP